MLDGLLIALQIAVVSMVLSLAIWVLSLVIGVMAAVGRLARNRLVAWRSTTYIEVFPATPLLLLIFFVFFGSARAGFGFGSITAEIVALTLYNSAVVAEIVARASSPSHAASSRRRAPSGSPTYNRCATSPYRWHCGAWRPAS